MGKTILHSLFAACLIFAPRIHAHDAVDYGVGFSLSLDYGLASIYFQNGSKADIAKIEGGPAYKQMIRATDVLDGTEALTPDIGAAQASLSLQSLRDYLPTWLGGTDARAQSLVPMLKALKTGTESYLEAPLSVAEVVMPFPVPNSYLDDLRSAGSSLLLHVHFSAQDPAGILVAHFYDLGGKCHWHGVEVDNDLVPLILTVDYSRAALTALLVTKDCGLLEYERVLHDTSLGADRVFGSSRSDSTREGLVRALRDLISLPLDYGNEVGLKRISNFILMGESASDRGCTMC